MHDPAELHNFRLITHFCSYSFYLFIYFFIGFVQISLKFQKEKLTTVMTSRSFRYVRSVVRISLAMK